jgi:hypothetical protein
MYMRVARIRVVSSWDPARYDELSQVTREVAATIKQLPGCQSVVIGGDPATGEGYAVGTYDTEDHARWPAPEALGDLPQRLHALGIQADTPQIFEVIAS